MSIHRLSGQIRKIAARHRVADGKKFRLKDHPTNLSGGLTRERDDGPPEDWSASLAELQNRLYAESRHTLLLIFQGLDASGKDGTIRHVMSGANPQSCRVVAFKEPGVEELRHDFLWRCARFLPERGTIGIFNRSYYEETLVVRVHPEFLDKQRLPAGCRGADLWKHRFESIRDFEKHLARNGVTLLKFFLHVSKAEQKRRLLARLDDPEKHWKFVPSDLADRARRDDYLAAYEQTIRNTATREAPWHIIPADDKGYMRRAVTATILAALQKIDPRFPEVSKKEMRELASARKRLMAER